MTATDIDINHMNEFDLISRMADIQRELTAANFNLDHILTSGWALYLLAGILCGIVLFILLGKADNATTEYRKLDHGLYMEKIKLSRDERKYLLYSLISLVIVAVLFVVMSYAFLEMYGLFLEKRIASYESELVMIEEALRLLQDVKG